MKIQKSSEDYLEAMLVLSQEKGFVRSIDIAERLGVTKPSVSYATKRLRENGYITMDPDGIIHLTAEGRQVAGRIYDRHRVITDLLIRLGVTPATARADACRLEHDISDETYQALAKLVK